MDGWMFDKKKNILEMEYFVCALQVYTVLSCFGNLKFRDCKDHLRLNSVMTASYAYNTNVFVLASNEDRSG